MKAAYKMKPLQKEDELHFVVPFAFIDGQVNPNLDSSDSYLDYLDCCVVLFSSIRRFYPNASISLYSNVAVPETWVTLLSHLDIDFKSIPFSFTPPTRFTTAFQGSLFLLDAISGLDRCQKHVLIDPDVVMVNRLPETFRKLDSNLIGVLELAIPQSFDMNGMSLNRQFEIQLNWGHPRPNHKYFGGEIYVIDGTQVARLTNEISKVWKKNLREFYAGRDYFRTEEHVLNYVLSQHDYFELRSHISRIWTSANYRLVPENYLDLTFWHLPSEKGFGFKKVARAALEQSSWFWTASDTDFRMILSRKMNVRGNTFILRLKRAAHMIWAHLIALIQKV